jgi:hypothetical protein
MGSDEWSGSGAGLTEGTGMARKGTTRIGTRPCHGRDRVSSGSGRIAALSSTGAAGLGEALSKSGNRPTDEVVWARCELR